MLPWSNIRLIIFQSSDAFRSSSKRLARPLLLEDLTYNFVAKMACSKSNVAVGPLETTSKYCTKCSWFKLRSDNASTAPEGGSQSWHCSVSFCWTLPRD